MVSLPYGTKAMNYRAVITSSDVPGGSFQFTTPCKLLK